MKIISKLPVNCTWWNVYAYLQKWQVQWKPEKLQRLKIIFVQKVNITHLRRDRLNPFLDVTNIQHFYSELCVHVSATYFYLSLSTTQGNYLHCESGKCKKKPANIKIRKRKIRLMKRTNVPDIMNKMHAEINLELKFSCQP